MSKDYITFSLKYLQENKDKLSGLEIKPVYSNYVIEKIDVDDRNILVINKHLDSYHDSMTVLRDHLRILSESVSISDRLVFLKIDGIIINEFIR